MPRISEPTVAEHRAARTRAMLDAAHALLLETGEAPRLSAVAERAGLARTSAYQYFASKQELLQAMVLDVYPVWTKQVTAAMDAAPTPADRILAYAAASLGLVADGAHAVGHALAALGPNEAVDDQAARMHREIQEPLIDAMADLGVADTDSLAELVNAVVHAAALRLEAGLERADALRLLEAVLGPFVREHGGRGVIDVSG